MSATGAIAGGLARWYARHARDLPWRRQRTPYGVWVAEVMLQQTQVKTVVGYWERWMRALPTIAALAAAAPARVLRLWEGLGYYHRARRLQEAARLIVREHGGRFPTQFDQILSLPGVGRYTAGAIASIAFNYPAPILDGNVIRVLSRLYGIRGDPHRHPANTRLWGLAAALVEAVGLGGDGRSGGRGEGEANPGQLNQALMELGALVCLPGQPRCPECPLRRRCVAARSGQAGQLPELPRRPRALARRWLVLVLEHRGRFLVQQRDGEGVNAHLWQFPNAEATAGDGDPSSLARRLVGMPVTSATLFHRLTHHITRYRITLEVFRACLPLHARRSAGTGTWRTLAQLDALPFSGAHRKIVAALGRQPEPDGRYRGRVRQR